MTQPRLLPFLLELRPRLNLRRVTDLEPAAMTLVLCVKVHVTHYSYHPSLRHTK